MFHLGVRVEYVGLRDFTILDRHCPRTVLNVGGDVVWTTICVASSDIHISGTCWAVVGEMRVHVGDLSRVCVHATGCFAGLDITPNHWGHVPFVVHEASIEIWRIVWRWRGDVGETSREGIFQEVEHGEELPWWHVQVVTEPRANVRQVSQE